MLGTIFPGGEGSKEFVVTGIDFKLPSCGAAAVRHGLDDLPPTLVGVGDGHSCRTVGCNSHRFHGSVTFPVGIVAGLLLCVIRAGGQACYRGRAIRARSEGRTTDRTGTGGICV